MFYIPILANTALHIYPNANGNGMYFQTIEGATMPILNLAFITIYGIVDGERLIISYNYAIGNWKRINKTYRYTILISFIYAIFMLLLLAFALGKPILHLFDIKGTQMMNDAYLVLLIQLMMLPAFSFQAPAMSIYMSIADTVRSNIASLFQDSITFFPVLGICYGICIATGSIWVLVSTYVINAAIASSLVTTYTHWWLKHRFGKIKTVSEVAGKPCVS
jgi:Na+-driven multidrug efflux pump